MKIVHTRNGYAIERKGRTWAKVLSGVLLAPWVLLTLLPATTGYGLGPLDVVWAVVFLLPAALLSFGPGRTKRWPVAAVVEARQVAGGVFVRAMDSRQVVHELVVDSVTAADLARTLTGIGR